MYSLLNFGYPNEKLSGAAKKLAGKAAVQRQLFLPVGDNYFSPLPLVNKGRDGE